MPSVSSLLLPLALSIAVGFLAGVFRLFDLTQARTLSRFVFLIAMPVAVLAFMRATEPPDLAYAGLVGGYLIATIIASLLALLLCRRVLGLTTQDAGAAVFATICGNAVFLGLPIALSVEGWAAPFLVLMLCEGVFVFALGTALMTWPEKSGAAAEAGVLKSSLLASYRAGRNPIVIATLIGFAVAAIGLRYPAPMENFLDLFGKIAGPAGLFVLGLYVALLPAQMERFEAKAHLVLLPVRLVLYPALTGAVVWTLTRDPVFTSVAALFTSLPPAVGAVAQAAHYRRYEAGTAALVASGTVVGLLTVALLLGFLLHR